MRARLVFEGSNGDATKAYYAKLQEKDAIGHVAMNLFRAQKCSTRAKLYRGGGFKQEAYQRKTWSLGLLVDCLMEHGAALGITFGWGRDDKAFEDHQDVLYIDLPIGQVSFHGTARGKGPDYTKSWDGQRGVSPARIIQFCDSVMGLEPDKEPLPALPPRDATARAKFKQQRDVELAKQVKLL